MIQLAAFWKRESKNNRTYYQGRLGNGRLLLFQNKDKKSEKSPDLLLYVVEDKSSTNKEDQERGQVQTANEADQASQDADVPF